MQGVSIGDSDPSIRQTAISRLSEIAARNELIGVLDDLVFLPALNADPQSYPRQDRNRLSEVQGWLTLKQSYYHSLTSAKQVISVFYDGLKSSLKRMSSLRLRTFRDAESTFYNICRKNGLW